jgi:hypothetical protein
MIRFSAFQSETFAQNQKVASDNTEPPVALNVSLNGYLDTYFNYKIGRQKELRNNPYFYSSERLEEFNVNLAYISLAVRHDRFRAKLTPALGSYMAANYSAEPPLFRNIFEASVGVRLGSNLWLDAGVLPSPYGYEGAISKDQLTYTRSFSAENTPYYVTGIRLAKNFGEAISLALFVTNGWQKIQQPMAGPCYGSQLQYKKGDRLLLNWSTFAGDQNTTTDADAKAQWRLLSNQYAWVKFGERAVVLGLFDIGFQQVPNLTNPKQLNWQLWHTANLTVKYKLTPSWSASLRGEYYSDSRSIVIVPITATAGGITGFDIHGGSLNIDWAPFPNAVLRLEGRVLFSSRDVFLDADDHPTNRSVFITASLATSF